MPKQQKSRAKKPKSRWSAALAFAQTSKGLLVIGTLLFALAGTGYMLATHALSPNANDHAVKPFVEDKKRGLVWTGLSVNNAVCPHGYYVAQAHGADPKDSCTHGPDPAPTGLDATQSVEPLSTGDTTTATAASNSGIICDGDGVTGNRVEMIYAHASDVPDRYSQFASSFQTYAANMNKEYVESGNQTGSPRSIRFVTDSNCNVVVHDETLSTTGDDSFGNTKSELKAKGYTRTDRKYIVWTDANVYCGIANVTGDSTPGQTNKNNVGPTFGRVDSGCWGGSVETHELTHTLGAVQLDAPHTSGGWHCNDDYDRMCYADGGSASNMYTACTNSADENHLDCNKDDYFSTSSSIASTNYLYNHWNVANSSFLIIGAPASTTTNPTPTPTPTPDTTLPTVTISSPADNAIIGSRTTIQASGSDNVGVTKLEVYVDNRLLSSTTSSSIQTNWNSRKASKGQHTITVKAYDAAGNVGLQTIYVVK